MAYTVPIPFFCLKLHFHSGGSFLSPLLDLQMVAMNESVRQLSGRFRDLYQKEVLNKGDFLQIMDLVVDGNYYKASMNIQFDAARDKVSFPAFELEFEYFFKKLEEGFWAVIPGLAVETFCRGETEEDLKASLNHAIRLEFLRNKRLSSVQKIISAIWFDSAELLQKEVRLNIPGIKSIDEGYDDKQERLLPKVAKPISADRKACYGRKAELEQLARALKSQFSRNVILVGPSGVGKTALVWEIVRQSGKRKIPGSCWETTASVLIKELTADTGWEDNLARLCQELSSGTDLLFIRNLLELFEVGKYSGNEVSMADFMRPYISRGEIRLITECTEEELSRIDLKSPNFTTYFQIIKVHEPVDDLEEIIISKVKDIAANRNLSIEKEAIKETIRLNRRFTPYAGFPGKPIRFLESILLNHKTAGQQVNRTDIIRSFCEETGMPRFIVDPDVPMDIGKIRSRFENSVYGQKQAVESITGLLASVKTALTRSGKPIVSLLFVGPTGVGKTEMAKILAEFMFGSKDRMLRFDMSEYSDPWSVLRLTGESYFKDGILTSAVRRTPFSVILFDEIEKAHSDFYDLLLQILGEGRLTDSKGKLVNFCSSIIIMTSNIGAGNVQNSPIGWEKNEKPEKNDNRFLSAVRKHFRPEFFNRIDEVIPFNPLSREIVHAVVNRELRLFKQREGVLFRKMDLFIKEEVLDHLAQSGYHPKYGARQLQRVIQQELIIPLAKQLNLYDYDDQVVVEVHLEESRIIMDIEADPLALELLLEELDKINYADYASDLRRQLHRLQHGHCYIRMLSQLDIFEAEKDEKKNAFWNDPQKSKRYADGLGFKSRLEQKCKEIEAFEKELSLSCLDLGAYNPKIINRLKDWEENFFSYKIDLLAHENPESNRMCLAVYGSNLRGILDLYLSVFKQGAIEFTAKSVWFREQFYKMKSVSSNGNEQGDAEELFIKQDWDGKAGIFPLKDRDLLYGVEFMLKGKCVSFLLGEEDGIHRWKMDAQNDNAYIIKTDPVRINTPANIHRKEFYKGSPRRIFTPEHIKDTRLKINREIPKKQFPEFILSTLEEKFRQKIDQELI